MICRWIGDGSPIKNLIAGGFGIFFALVGVDNVASAHEVVQGELRVVDYDNVDGVAAAAAVVLVGALAVQQALVGVDGDQVGGVWNGSLLVPEDAEYQFWQRRDDGGVVMIDVDGNGTGTQRIVRGDEPI